MVSIDNSAANASDITGGAHDNSRPVPDQIQRGVDENTLSNDSQLFRSLMDQLPEYVYFKDKKSRFVRINAALAGYFGLQSPEAAIGKCDRDFFTKEHADAAAIDEKRVMETGIAIGAKEERETWPDGRVTWVATTRAPLFDSAGRTIGTFGISRDITAQKKSEERLHLMEERVQQSEKMESLGIMASGIAHDFNNLLTAVLGSVSVAQTLRVDNDSLKAILKDIETGAVQASDLSNQLLAFAGRGRMVLAHLDFASIVKETARLLERALHRSIVVRYSLAENLPGIEGDSTQIRQVVMNLITNAADAIGDKSGTITIATGMVECDERYLEQVSFSGDLTVGRYVSIEVSDTGCGIPHEIRDKIFDPFFTTKATGKGLGLATVAGIVRSHRGAIKLYSEQGKGTTFRVLFPALAHSVETKVKEKPGQLWQGSGTVLVVDDEELICRIACQMVRRLGFKVLSAGSAAEALDVFGQHKDEISVVLLDEVMPQGDGSEVFAAIKSVKPDVRVILYSGYSQSDVMSRLSLKGLSGFIQKPFTVQVLADSIRIAMESKA